MQLKVRITLVANALLAAFTVYATTPAVEVTVHAVSSTGIGKPVGTVTFSDSRYGLMIAPNLRGLGAGPHAAHIHQNPSCEPSADGVPAGAAGQHYDPLGSNKHAGPYGDGHYGDLPNLMVDNNGVANLPVVAPRISVSDVKGRAIMIQAGADHYNDHSMHHHGKGGDRMYCGVIE